MESLKQNRVNTNDIMFPDAIFNNILSYCIDIDTFKTDTNKEGLLEKITIKNVNLQSIAFCSANIVDDITNSSRSEIIEES